MNNTCPLFTCERLDSFNEKNKTKKQYFAGSGEKSCGFYSRLISFIYSVSASMADASSMDHSFSHGGKTASYYFCYFPIKTGEKHQRRNDLINNVEGLCTAVCILQITLC